MSKEIFFGKNSLRYLFFKYKESKYFVISYLTFVVIACLVLIVWVIVPQFNNYLSIRNQVKAKREIVSNINNNINIINELDKQALDSQLDILVKVLPFDSDFASIISILNDVSLKSGVTLSDFNFNVGEIASESAIPTQTNNSSDLLSDNAENFEPESQEHNDGNMIDTTVAINGNYKSMILFLENLENSIPLSEVSSVSINKGIATINLKFYYKPFKEVIYSENKLIDTLNNQHLQKINYFVSIRSIDSNDQIILDNDSSLPLFE